MEGFLLALVAENTPKLELLVVGNIECIQGETHKVLQSDNTQIIDHVQKCVRPKFQCSRMLSYWTTQFFLSVEALKLRQGEHHFLKWNDVFFRCHYYQILRRIQRPTTQGHSSHVKYENSRKIETYRNNYFQRFH